MYWRWKEQCIIIITSNTFFYKQRIIIITCQHWWPRLSLTISLTVKSAFSHVSHLLSDLHTDHVAGFTLECLLISALLNLLIHPHPATLIYHYICSVRSCVHGNIQDIFDNDCVSDIPWWACTMSLTRESRDRNKLLVCIMWSMTNVSTSFCSESTDYIMDTLSCT